MHAKPGMRQVESRALGFHWQLWCFVKLCLHLIFVGTVSSEYEL